MSNYSCDGHLFRPWVYSVCVSMHTGDCMQLCVWSYSHHTYMPPPHCRAVTTSPRDTIKRPGRKAGQSGWTLRRGRLTRQLLSFLVSEGSFARRRRPEMSEQSKSAICFNTVGCLRDVKQSQHVSSLCLLCTEPCMLTQRETGRPDQATVSQQLRWPACRAAELTGHGH